MPLSKANAIRHLEKARSNYGLYQSLRADATRLDWAVTVLFYTALHLTQAFIVENAVTGFDVPHDHTERDSSIARLLPGIYAHYRFLGTRSQWARYHVDKPEPTRADLQDYEDHRFRPIETALAHLGVAL